MVTTVANSLFDRLIEAFPPDRPYGRDAIRREPMPAPVADYLEHLLDAKLRAVISQEPSTDAWIDTSDADVVEARRRYVALMERHQAVPAREWADVLRSACHNTIRFLVRPASTLGDDVFNASSESADAEAVFDAVDYYPAYPYFRNVIEAYFEQKGATRIDRERFEGLVRRIDRQMTSDFSAPQWLRLLQPLVNVLSAAGHEEIPLEILKPFLQEKQADGPLRKLKHQFGLDGFVPFDQLESVFERDPEPEPESKESRPTEVRRAPERPAAAGRDDPLPLWRQFEPGYESASNERESSRPKEPDESSEPLWKQFRKPSEPAQRNARRPSNLQDLEQTVLGDRGKRNRDLFVKHLFAGRPEEYEATLKRLSQAANWSQASQIIAQDVFLKHQVNIYSDPAVAFTDAAEAQYRS